MFGALFRGLVAEGALCHGLVCEFRVADDSSDAKINETRRAFYKNPWIYTYDQVLWAEKDNFIRLHDISELDGSKAAHTFLFTILGDPAAWNCGQFTAAHAHVDERGNFSLTGVDGASSPKEVMACLESLAQHPPPLPASMSVIPGDAAMARVPSP